MDATSLLADVGEQSGDFALHCSETAGQLGQLIDQIEFEADRLGILRSAMADLEANQDESKLAAEELLATASVAESLLARGNLATSESLGTIKRLIDGVLGLEGQMHSFLGVIATLGGISKSLKLLAEQTEILGLNAQIEAARGGVQTKGFAVVADEIRRLSKSSAESAETVGTRLDQLELAARELIGGVESNIANGREAGRHIDHVSENLGELAALVVQFKDRSETIARHTHGSTVQVAKLSEGIADFHELAAISVARAGTARVQLDHLESRANDILNQVSQDGVETRNSPFIAMAIDGAAEVAEIIDQALASGELSQTQLFDTNYRPIAGSDPVQYDNGFAGFADVRIRPLLDRHTARHPAVVGCCLVDRNGYLPTHISERSQRQRPGDRKRNLEYSRNRQIFLDNQTRRALVGEGDYIVYTYRQDFGDGRFRALRSVFVPLQFEGKRWGLYEVGYLI